MKSHVPIQMEPIQEPTLDMRGISGTQNPRVASCREKKRKLTLFLLCAMAFLLCLWSVFGTNPIDFFGDSVDALPEILQMFVVSLILPFMMLHVLGFMIGSGVLAILAYTLSCRRFPMTHDFRLIFFPIMGMVWLAVQATCFLRVPAGTSIRPMAWSGYTMTGAFVLMILSFAKSFASFRSRKNKGIPVLAMLLSMLIWMSPLLSLGVVARFKGFNLSP